MTSWHEYHQYELENGGMDDRHDTQEIAADVIREAYDALDLDQTGQPFELDALDFYRE